MKPIRVFVMACALSVGSLASAPAQITIDKDAIQAAIAAKMAEEGGAGGGGGRRAPAAGPAASTGPKGWSDFKAIKGQFDAQGGAPRKKSSWSYGEVLSGKTAPAARSGVQSVVQQVIKKKITVIAGTRVTDAVTGELLDDARELRVEEEKKSEYFDDGTNGDLVAGDGQYTRVEEITGVLGPHNQRIKEQLIQAVYEISRLDAREFYGHTLMSADDSTRPERNVRWALVDAPEGQAGFRLSEVAAEKSVEVPNYWNEEMSRDEKIAGPNGWARSFLDEYRVVKGGLDSEFYTPYVPQPPSIPKLPPPSVEGWSPFVQTAAGEEGDALAGMPGGGGAQKQGKGVGKAATGALSKFMGTGATSGAYFGQ